MTNNVQEYKVGSGTQVADTKKSEKRAQITLKAIQLRLKQEKERAALQAQRSALKEVIEESFSASQIAALKAEYSKINTVDPDSDMYKKLIAMLDRLDLKSLKSLAGAEVKFVSKLAQNRVARKSVKEEFQLDELSNEKLADYKKKAGADASAADKAGDMKKGNKRFSGIMKATKKQFANDSKKEVTEMDNTDPHSGPEREIKPTVNKHKIKYKKHEKEIVKEAEARIARKEGQPAKSDKHSDLYTDEDPKGTIHGLKFATADDAKESVNKIKSSDRTHAHKIQAAVAMEQRAKVMRKKEAAAVYREYIESMKKMTKEELSPKQKAMDKNKNGKIDGEDLAKLRGEELSAKQKALDKNKNGKIDGSDLAKLRGEELSTKQSADDKKKSFINRMANRSKLLNQPKPDDEYKRKVVQHLKKKYNEEVEIAEAGPGLWANIHAKRQRIKAGSNERMRKAGEKGAPESGALDRARGKNEAASPAQQAAIAIAMKKDGKKPKDMEESDAYDKNVKPSDKPHDKDAAAKRAKLAALAARKKMTEGLMDKIKAMKRGMQAKAKADDHFDKAGDPKNANASKDLKKAVRYTNLLNKEEVVTEARKKTLKDMKKKIKTEETPDGSTVKKGDALTGKREPIEINPELKEPAR